MLGSDFMSNKRYYWLQLNENFFDDDTISWIEEQESGKDYVLFYLKLCLKSLSNDGYLVRYVGQTLVPYDVKALAKLTNTEIDTVKVAMDIFIRIGLISRLDTGEIYMNQIDEMIGSETDSARRMRKKRVRDKQRNKLENKTPSQCDSDVQKSDTEIDIEIEKDIEKDIDIEKNIDIEKDIDKELEIDKDSTIVVNSKTVNDPAFCSDVNDLFFYCLTHESVLGNINDNTSNEIRNYAEQLSVELVSYALKRAVNKNANFGYAKKILDNWVENEVTNKEEARELESTYYHDNYSP